MSQDSQTNNIPTGLSVDQMIEGLVAVIKNVPGAAKTFHRAIQPVEQPTQLSSSSDAQLAALTEMMRRMENRLESVAGTQKALISSMDVMRHEFGRRMRDLESDRNIGVSGARTRYRFVDPELTVEGKHTLEDFRDLVVRSKFGR